MRRNDREIKSFNEVIAVLNRCDVIYLAMTDNGKPYAVPMNFGINVSDNKVRLLFHSAKEGRKINILKSNPVVSFAAHSKCDIKSGDAACEWTAEFESIIGNGRVSFITDIEEKSAALDSIMLHSGFEGAPQYNVAALEAVCIFSVEVDEITGKKN